MFNKFTSRYKTIKISKYINCPIFAKNRPILILQVQTLFKLVVPFSDIWQKIFQALMLVSKIFSWLSFWIKSLLVALYVQQMISSVLCCVFQKWKWLSARIGDESERLIHFVAYLLSELLKRALGHDSCVCEPSNVWLNSNHWAWLYLGLEWGRFCDLTFLIAKGCRVFVHEQSLDCLCGAGIRPGFFFSTLKIRWLVERSVFQFSKETIRNLCKEHNL